MSCFSRLRMYDNEKRLPKIKNWLCFESLADGSKLTLCLPQRVNSSLVKSVSYSTTNGSSWTIIPNTSDEIYTPILTINKGEKVYFKGDAKCYFGSVYNSIYLEDFAHFFTNTADANNQYTWYGDTPGIFKVSGNIMSMLYGDDFEDKKEIPSEKCFEGLFATATGITTAPELPATNLKNDCYRAMFRNCKNLVSSPDLPAETLPAGSYAQMFETCTNIQKIKTFCKSIGTDALLKWLPTGISSTGVFYKNSQWNDYTLGESGIPSGWTIQNITRI